jgi:hypothetical protein
MTREEAANVLWWASKQHHPGDQMDITEYHIEAFDMAIDALREPAHEWVRTVDRLPEDGKRVLVTECGRVFVERFDRLLGFDTPTTHWMPLPQPPKEESDE